MRGIEIHFPITPTLCLTFICSELVNEVKSLVKIHRIRASQGNAFPADMSAPERLINHLNGKEARVLKPENIEFNNSLQVIQSSRFVYSNKKTFELAKDMIKTNPELSKPEGLYSNVYSV